MKVLRGGKDPTEVVVLQRTVTLAADAARELRRIESDYEPEEWPPEREVIGNALRTIQRCLWEVNEALIKDTMRPGCAELAVLEAISEAWEAGRIRGQLLAMARMPIPKPPEGVKKPRRRRK